MTKQAEGPWEYTSRLDVADTSGQPVPKGSSKYLKALLRRYQEKPRNFRDWKGSGLGGWKLTGNYEVGQDKQPTAAKQETPQNKATGAVAKGRPKSTPSIDFGKHPKIDAIARFKARMQERLKKRQRPVAKK